MQVQQENKMGVMPVNRLLISMSLPMMASMLVLALYNVVDSVFVSQINEKALTAVSLAFPVQNLMISVAAGTGVGINALLSRSLGEKNFKEANKAANNGVFLAFLSYALFAVLGALFSRTFFQLMTDDPQIIEYGTSYLSVCCIMSFGLFGQVAFERLMQSTGKTFYNMLTQGLGAVINIILDPIMIFGLLGCPAMGVAGAAWATVIGQIAGMLLGVYFNIKKNTEIKLSFRGFRPSGATVGRIYAVGVPSIIMASIGSVMTFGMNKILLTFTSTATAVFGVYFKLQSFIFMPVFGLNNGMVPIIAYNYGAQNRDRMVKVLKLSILYAVGIMVIGFLTFQLVPGPLLSIFNASAEMMAIGKTALRVISVSFLGAGFCISVSSLFQALGNGMLSLLMSLTRQLIVLLPVGYLLSRTGNLALVWWAFPIAEIFSIILTLVFLRHVYRNTIALIGSGQPENRDEKRKARIPAAQKD